RTAISSFAHRRSTSPMARASMPHRSKKPLNRHAFRISRLRKLTAACRVLGWPRFEPGWVRVAYSVDCVNRFIVLMHSDNCTLRGSGGTMPKSRREFLVRLGRAGAASALASLQSVAGTTGPGGDVGAKPEAGRMDNMP